MKLKHVVASMTVLGLISCPVFAANTDTTTTTTTTEAEAATPTKHKHHAHHHHNIVEVSHVERTVEVTHDYKDMGALPVVELPRLDVFQTIYDSMSQNSGRSKPMPDWFNRIGLSGGINFDAHWGNRSMGYQGENNRRLSLNDAYLNAQVVVNDWTRGFTSFSFENNSVAIPTSLTTVGASPKAGTYSTAYNSGTTVNTNVHFEQGFVTIANYEVSPLFFQIGKQFTSYGRYQIHPIERSLTEVATESLQTSAKLGFITRMGLHGDIYAFDNAMQLVTQSHTKTVYGASLGFDQINDQLGFDVGLGYMSQLTGVNDIAYSVTNFRGAATFTHTVGGIAVYGDVNSGPFTLSGRFSTAIQHFSPADLSTLYNPPVTPLATVGASGARPWTADLTAGFGFNYWARNQNLYVGFQASNDAVNLYLPKNRWIAGYNIDMWKYTNIGAEFGHDKDYSSGNGGTGRSSNTFAARASVKFG